MYNVTALMSSSSSSTSNRRHLSLCAVCGDKASGKHYGVMSCDGCRGFFKRSVRRKIEYKCKGDSTCQVDVNRRNQCQACRFQRCLAVHMKPSAVQNERAPRLGNKRTTTRGQCWTPPPPTVGYVAQAQQVTGPFGFRHFLGNNTSSPIWSTSRMYLPQQSFNISKCSAESDETQTSLDVTNDDASTSILCETASCVLLESIRWLYSVPSFKQLDEYDQLTLIEQSWNLLFLFTSAEMKKFTDQNPMDSINDDEQYLSFQSVVKELLLLSMDATEFTLLKLILIFTIPNHLDLHDRVSIDRYRKDALFMLTEYTRISKYRRLAELLMLLSNVQEKLHQVNLDEIFFQHFITRIPMKHLLHNIVRHIR